MTRPIESVWEYPRPPRLEPTHREVVVVLGGNVVARTTRAVRVLETSHPPSFYLPPDDVHPEALVPTSGRSMCEWKGIATYYDVHGGSSLATRAAWTYLVPTESFVSLAGLVAFYPAAMDFCTVGGERVRPQPGGFYGGWITDEIAGPFAGDADEEHR